MNTQEHQAQLQKNHNELMKKMDLLIQWLIRLNEELARKC